MDTGYTIPADICGDVKTDIDGLLDFARLHGTPLDAFRAAQFLSGGLHRRALAAAGSGPVTRRRNKALQQKAKRSAKTAKIRAARNDGRRRLVERTKAQTEFHDMDAIPESSDSDSDVPLSQHCASTARTTLLSLTPLPTPFATPIPDPQPSNSYHDDGESEAPLSESEEPMELDADWQAQAEAAVEGWICHNCDTPVTLVRKATKRPSGEKLAPEALRTFRKRSMSKCAAMVLFPGG